MESPTAYPIYLSCTVLTTCGVLVSLIQAIMKALAENKQTAVSELRLANQVSVCGGGRDG